MYPPLALQLRKLPSLVEIGVDRNTTVVFPAPLMSTIGELGALPRPGTSAATPSNVVVPEISTTDSAANGTRPTSTTYDAGTRPRATNPTSVEAAPTLPGSG